MFQKRNVPSVDVSTREKFYYLLKIFKRFEGAYYRIPVCTRTSLVARKLADFGDKLKRTKIGDMSEALVSGPLKTVTLDQYVKYGAKTNEGTVIYTEKGVAVPAKTADSMVHVIKAEDEAKITKYLLEKFSDFYKEIAPVLTDICKNLKNSPVRLEGVNIEMAPFGIGGSITIGINYDSSIFGQEK